MLNRIIALAAITLLATIHASQEPASCPKAAHKIIYLISPPRSLSVAFLRMMEARKDFAIMHEPSQWAFNKGRGNYGAENWFVEQAPQNYNEVKEQILNRAQHSDVFVKEMGFAVRDFLLEEKALLENPNIYFVFLIRNPHATVISMFNKLHKVTNDFSEFSYLAGYRSTYEIYERVKNTAVHMPYVICTEDLYAQPERTVRKFCEYVGIQYKPEAMNWQNLGDSFSGQQEWHEIKYKESTQHWHGEAIHSTGFGVPTQYKRDGNGMPTFEELANPHHRKICRDAYDENVAYYELLLHGAQAGGF